MWLPSGAGTTSRSKTIWVLHGWNFGLAASLIGPIAPSSRGVVVTSWKPSTCGFERSSSTEHRRSFIMFGSADAQLTQSKRFCSWRVMRFTMLRLQLLFNTPKQLCAFSFGCSTNSTSRFAKKRLLFLQVRSRYVIFCSMRMRDFRPC